MARSIVATSTVAFTTSRRDDDDEGSRHKSTTTSSEMDLDENGIYTTEVSISTSLRRVLVLEQQQQQVDLRVDLQTFLALEQPQQVDLRVGLLVQGDGQQTLASPTGPGPWGSCRQEFL
eukprot:CAMPEP_0194752302 /NCGR_PEP_ID=MMETSP0323_2-20130528/6080_1 /TAXON_ID=2866 ORGANISM="Crypthecodinium cohnii, Strain Seligo" /NCGR_SAMPLE_ID=MMETSP0323_2 /ASSEMBLY_ACC=CAM_ASM_000346 /LENGTH=118 /DNA_ID=CAMNT_0039669103 /DNA_START=136 /DNA_END=489 /DNA_ORIENTATION=-